MIEILKDDKNNHKKVFSFMKKYNYLSFYLNRKNKNFSNVLLKMLLDFKPKNLNC